MEYACLSGTIGMIENMSSMFKMSLKKKRAQTYAQNVGANWFYALSNKV